VCVCDQLPVASSVVESPERPSMDLFKAIFENSEPSSSSSSSGEDNDEDEDQQQTIVDADNASTARVTESTTLPDTAVDVTADFAVSDASPLTSQQPQPEQPGHSEPTSVFTDGGRKPCL